VYIVYVHDSQPVTRTDSKFRPLLNFSGSTSFFYLAAVILQYAGTMAPVLLVVGGEKAELAQALVPR